MKQLKIFRKSGTLMRMWRAFSEIRKTPEKMKRDFVMPPGTSRFSLLLDYIFCIWKYHISFSEYFHQYKFYTLKRCEREEYITRSKAHKIEGELNRKVRDIFWYKNRFLRRFSDFAKRDWIYFGEASADECNRFCSANRLFIIKPVADSLGQGIKLITIDETTDIPALYKELSAGNFIAEEYITACKEISEFNPGSLNTIRVVTHCKGDNFQVFGSFIRMGVRGSFIDNAHAGGIFAGIDIETGIVATEGTTTNGAKYILHPTSGKQIIGFRIPLWNKIIETCRQASLSIPEARIVGWDVAVAKDYSIIIIEGNHMPDFDVLQSTARKGVKRKFLEITKS